MRSLIGTALAIGTLVLYAALAPRANADEWNKKTIVTFSEAVEVPGHVLPAGTYIFKLMESNSDRNIVQIWSKDGQHYITTVLAIPCIREEPANQPIFDLEERPSGSPMAIKYWYYTGETTGKNFPINPISVTTTAKSAG
jgi:hypothetical protein